MGAAGAGDLGRVTVLAATILAISAVPEEVKAEALENPAAWSWEGGDEAGDATGAMSSRRVGRRWAGGASQRCRRWGG